MPFATHAQLITSASNGRLQVDNDREQTTARLPPTKEKLLGVLFDELNDSRRKLGRARGTLSNAKADVDDVLDRIRSLILTD